MKLHCFALNSDPPKIVPARASRQWMDDFPDRHAYRCLPLTIANQGGGLASVTSMYDAARAVGEQVRRGDDAELHGDRVLRPVANHTALTARSRAICRWLLPQ